MGMSARVLFICCTLLLAASSAEADTCYWTEYNVGCDPENYGYDEESCPASCTGNEMSGCLEGEANVEYYLTKWPSFATMPLDHTVSTEEEAVGHSVWTGSDDLDGTYLVCLTEGNCECEMYSPTVFVCSPSEEYRWEEWFAEEIASGCTFEGDPEDPEYPEE